MNVTRPLIFALALAISSAALTTTAGAAGESVAGDGWAVDESYGSDGLTQIAGVYTSDSVVLPDGSAYVVVGPIRRASPLRKRNLVRLSPSGEIDEDFGVDGFARIRVGPREHLRMALQQTAKGPRLVLSQWAVFGTAKFYRFRMDGRPDRSFGDRGVSTIDLGRKMYLRQLAISDQHIVSAGDCPIGPTRSFPCILALTPDGVVDSGFAGNGLRVWKDLGTDVPLNSVAMTPDGSRIYIGGGARRPHGWMIAAFEPNGRLDTEFGDGGVSRARPGCGPSYAVASLHLESSGDLVAVGGACEATVFARVTSDGELDEDYGEEGWIAIGDDGEDDMFPSDSIFDPATETVHLLYGGEDGALHLTGVRSDGSLDPGFGPTGELVIELDPPATGFWNPNLGLDGVGRLYAEAWYPNEVDFRGLVMSRIAYD